MDVSQEPKKVEEREDDGEEKKDVGKEEEKEVESGVHSQSASKLDDDDEAVSPDGVSPVGTEADPVDDVSSIQTATVEEPRLSSDATADPATICDKATSSAVDAPTEVVAVDESVSNQEIPVPKEEEAEMADVPLDTGPPDGTQQADEVL